MISLTETAAKKAQYHISAREGTKGLRIAVRTTGCSGMAYILEFVDEILPDDMTFEDKDVTLVIDKLHLTYLDGLTLDYQKKGLNEGFEFINPNESARCGCGESFTV